MDSPAFKLAACSVCLRTPCACPDPADESDEQAAEEEAAYVRALLADAEREDGRRV